MTAPLAIAPDPLAALPEPLRWLIGRATPDEPALGIVQPGVSAESLCTAWLKEEQFPSVVRLIACVLPSRESIWWAWVSARHATQMPGAAAPTADMHTAMSLVEQWIVRPDDDARRAAWDAGNAAGLDTPIGMVATAVFLSGTSIAPASSPPLPPPPGVTTAIVAGVIMLSAASNKDPLQIAPTLSAFSAQGLEIVKRLGGWDASLKLAYDSHQRAQQEYVRATQPPVAR